MTRLRREGKEEVPDTDEFNIAINTTQHLAFNVVTLQLIEIQLGTRKLHKTSLIKYKIETSTHTMTRDNKKKYGDKKQDEHKNKPIIQQTWVDMAHEDIAHGVRVEKLKTTSQSGNDGDTKRLLHTTKKKQRLEYATTTEGKEGRALRNSRLQRP